MLCLYVNLQAYWLYIELEYDDLFSVLHISHKYIKSHTNNISHYESLCFITVELFYIIIKTFFRNFYNFLVGSHLGTFMVPHIFELFCYIWSNDQWSVTWHTASLMSGDYISLTFGIIILLSTNGPSRHRSWECWMICRGPGFLAGVWFGSSPAPSSPLSSQHVVSLCQSSRIYTVNTWNIYNEISED